MSFELITANQHPNMDYRIANTNYGFDAHNMNIRNKTLIFVVE